MSEVILEARDLLFARLLQYRAFKDISVWFNSRIESESRRHPRNVRLEEKYREKIPELVWTTSVGDFATIAMLALAPREIPVVGLDHLHAPLVSVREQAAIVVSLVRAGATTFRQIIAGADQKSGTCFSMPGHRPDHAHSGYFCPAGPQL